ncbi:PREDICTED: uncharacterized protein LOC109178683 [Ipomoea nil]|uniref:uncharacterized protein LOC109178683 n=1 Tax=Ipomoea nil TaxID=35883 RepID=UPI00090095A5|nr:PREDICTED: uncharacterized protein LOC109178683 [Ipomoea nil]
MRADVPRSTVRKAGRGMPTLIYIYSVARTTFKGHCLDVLVSWIVQVGIDTWRLFKSKDEMEQKVRMLGKKVYIATVRCGASLVFMAIGAGIGASFLPPSTGQSIGCAIGGMLLDYLDPSLFQCASNIKSFK